MSMRSRRTFSCRALLLSEAGLFAARAITVPPTRDEVTVSSCCGACACPCRLRMHEDARHGQLDGLGDRRAASAISGVLSTHASRAFAEASPGSPAMSGWPTLTSRGMNGTLRWSPMACACGTGLSSPLTPPSCPPARRGEAHQRRQSCCQAHAGVTALTPNSAVPDDAALSSSAPPLAAGSALIQCPAAITAWVARWSSLLAVAAQRAFASLLELPPAAGLSDGPAA